ncbi:armadillo repeat-containing X-linked protein 1 isoform X4 [Bubalus bubalis]|uniref:armadillo repeat-containing X-linked protein 1 isoform X4 n=1 Tax=Bubalus bubalis TaxID=89462 RepID=UPI001D10C5E0|nr:armadillo repeat-containing X-linked protein 1 isoform X4 [Bubalus bubalis]
MDMGTDVVSVNQRKANANYKRSYFWFLGSAEEHEWQDLLWRGRKGGGPAPAALLVGVVIGVLSSRVTWLSREQELDICRRPSNPGLRLVRLPSPFYLEGGRACGQEKRRRRSNQNLGAVRLSCHSPCLSVGRCTAPSKGIKNLPRSPAGPCKAIPSLLCRLSVSVDLAPEGQFNPRSRKKRKIALKQVCRKSVLLQARNRRKKLPGPVRVYVGVPLPPGHLQGQVRSVGQSVCMQRRKKEETEALNLLSLCPQVPVAAAEPAGCS